MAIQYIATADLLEPRQIPIGFFPKKKYRRRMLM